MLEGEANVLIRAVFFDAGDTLIHRWVHKTERFRWLCERAGISAESTQWLAAAQALELHFQNRHLYRHYYRSEEWRQELVKVGLRAAGIAGDLDELSKRLVALDDELPEEYVADESAAAVLEHLRSLDYRLVIVSNWDGTLVDHVRRADLGGYFDAILDSSVVGFKKPDPRIFQLACAVSGVAPEEAVHVGDSPYPDGHGALSAGVRPVIYDPLDALGEHELARGSRRIRTLPEVLEVLESLESLQDCDQDGSA